jgi:hypothetical protein
MVGNSAAAFILQAQLPQNSFSRILLGSGDTFSMSYILRCGAALFVHLCRRCFDLKAVALLKAV